MFHADRRMPGSNFGITTSITPLNIPPIVYDVNVVTSVNKPVDIPLAGYDPDLNTPLWFRVMSAVSSGSLSQAVGGNFDSGTTLRYTPATGATGTVQFTYSMYDGFDYSTIATVTITIQAVYSPPVAFDSIYNVTIGTTLSQKLPVSYSDTTKTLQYQLLTAGTIGIAQIINDTLIYEPVNVGQETLNWVVTDGRSLAGARVTLYVMLGQPPVVTDQNIRGPANSTIHFLLDATDVDTPKAQLTFECVAPELHPSAMYACDKDAVHFMSAYSGVSLLTWEVSDGYSLRASTATVTFDSVFPPVPQEMSFSIPIYTALQITLQATDVDTQQQDLNFHVVKRPSGGILQDRGNVLLYFGDVAGEHIVSWTVSDDRFTSNVTNITINVIPESVVNDTS
jgi:hypothetical protein